LAERRQTTVNLNTLDPSLGRFVHIPFSKRFSRKMIHHNHFNKVELTWRQPGSPAVLRLTISR
jgi:hypothetical protein